MLNSKLFTAFEKAKKNVAKCNNKCSYKNKEAKEIQDKLDEKYKAKIDAALKLPAKDMGPRIQQINIEKRAEMKMNEVISRQHECMLNECPKDIDAYKKALLDIARYIIADSEKRLRDGGLQPDIAKYLKGVIVTNKKRIKLLTQTVSVPRLIDILYPS